jgi:3-methyladenine DNA glycosylase/8-oxoguanine DNA glycosylase
LPEVNRAARTPAARTPDRRTLLPHFRRADAVMAALVEQAGPYRLRAEPCESPFRHLVRAIASQQISGRAADAILARVVALYDGEDFPTPGAVRDTPVPRLRSVGLSAAKAAALQDLARHTLSGVVPDSAVLDRLDDAAVEALHQLGVAAHHDLALGDDRPADQRDLRPDRQHHGADALP